MKIVKVICDLTKQEIEDNKRIKLSATSENEISEQESELLKKFATLDFSFEALKQIIDLCTESSEPEKIVQNFSPSEEKQNSDCAPAEEEKPKRKIDAGKLIALKNAGWSNIAIADELNTETQYVANFICKYRKLSPEEQKYGILK